MSILSEYKVKFLDQPPYGRYLSTINGILTGYISDHYNLRRVNQLLNSINGVLDGTYQRGGGQTQSLYLADIGINETKIYQDMEEWEQNNNIQPDFVLPTTDFMVIVEAWRDYLANG